MGVNLVCIRVLFSMVLIENLLLIFFIWSLLLFVWIVLVSEIVVVFWLFLLLVGRKLRRVLLLCFM